MKEGDNPAKRVAEGERLITYFGQNLATSLGNYINEPNTENMQLLASQLGKLIKEDESPAKPAIAIEVIITAFEKRLEDEMAKLERKILKGVDQRIAPVAKTANDARLWGPEVFGNNNPTS